MIHPLRLVASLALCQLAFPALAAAPSLPALGADPGNTSVSGISSGGFMAAQLATAYSARFRGVGVIAAGPYYCAGTYAALSLFQNATTTCMTPSTAASGADGAASLRNAAQFARQGLIDPVSNLARQRVYAFSGSSDHTVKTSVVDQVKQYYLLAGAAPANILYRHDSDAGHSIITASDGDVSCADTRPPYINNCGFTQSQELLRHLAGGTSKPAAKAPLTGDLLQFDQREFVRGPLASMYNSGAVYIPRYCRSNSCGIHVALHGCQQGAGEIGERFYRSTGYNEYADSNALIVLYPQAQVSRGVPVNPQGCWDFWGYSNSKDQPPFYAKGAPQMAAIVAMIERLGSARAVQSTPVKP
ncbi:PHB depolymerase family esterase [Massilia sp. CF038]|uniref:extracellular catalytic domain type 2 short-chain-length polyhydroxyalkanoate depolymerase n=1 Tax=Massilia sp. CF038 TaxID=1881045 RepID=UPI0009193165|nr:PHB depolymerase family esterase [Massilia sp. CF038]SHG48665.1 poly(3-hydroxybutyrate) depolymerase [Massilia sp. CF038]